MVTEAEQAAELIEQNQQASVQLVNARFIKPLDNKLLRKYCSHARIIVTIEENQLRGGFGQVIADYLLAHDFKGKFKALGIDNEFTSHGTREQNLRDVRLDPEGIAAAIGAFLDDHYKSGGILHKLSFRKNSRRKEDDSHVTVTDPDLK